MIKVHAGDWGKTVAVVGPGWSGRRRICFSKGLFKKPSAYFFDADIQSVEIVTEANAKRLAGAAGWGIAGGALLGPVGLLAGLVLGGKGRDITFVCVFSDGKKMLATADQKTFKELQISAIGKCLNNQPPVPMSKKEIIDQISRLAELKESGILTESEFEAKKTEMLSRL